MLWKKWQLNAKPVSQEIHFFFVSARRFESAEFLHAEKINYQKPFESFFRAIVLFDRIARRAFCNSVDLKDQQETFRAFSRAREKHRYT